MKFLSIIFVALVVLLSGAATASPEGNANWRASHYSGPFTVVEDCINYPGKFWEWRIAKCKALDPKLSLPAPGKTHVRE